MGTIHVVTEEGLQPATRPEVVKPIVCSDVVGLAANNGCGELSSGGMDERIVPGSVPQYPLFKGDVIFDREVLECFDINLPLGRCHGTNEVIRERQSCLDLWVLRHISDCMQVRMRLNYHFLARFLVLVTSLQGYGSVEHLPNLVAFSVLFNQFQAKLLG